MDWFKIKVQHVLNTGLTPEEIGRLIQFQALVALKERYPTDAEIKKVMRLKTLQNLDKSMKETGINLSFIANKVLFDVEELELKRERSKERKRKQRADSRLNKENVPRDVTGSGHTPVTVQRREEKRREEYKLNTSNKLEVKKSPQKRTIFTPPTQNEINNFFNEYSTQNRISGVDLINEPVRFFDFYSSKGWLVGKVKMKDWKAAARNWMRRNQSERNESGKRNDLTQDEVYDAVNGPSQFNFV